MRDRDQRACSLGYRLTFEIHDSVFGHDVHHVGARRGDDIAVVDARDDAAGASGVALESRSEADERFAFARGIGAADELQLSAGATDLPDACGFGACLSGEIDLRRVAD